MLCEDTFQQVIRAKCQSLCRRQQAGKTFGAKKSVSDDLCGSRTIKKKGLDCCRCCMISTSIVHLSLIKCRLCKNVKVKDHHIGERRDFAQTYKRLGYSLYYQLVV